MRLNDIILEDEVTDEGVLGGLVGAAKGLMKGSPVKGYQSGYAQSQGADQTKAQATTLYKDFFNQVGKTGQAPSGNALIDYLTKKQYPITKAKAVLNAAVPVRAQPQTPAQGNVPMVEPTLSPPNVPTTPTPAATVPPSVLKPNPARGKPPVAEARGDNIGLDAKTVWRAILAATQENLRIGGNGLSPTVRTSTSSIAGSAGVSNPAMRGSSGGMGNPGGRQSRNANITPEAVIGWYKTLDEVSRKNFKLLLAQADTEVTTMPNTTPTAEGYSRFLGRSL